MLITRIQAAKMLCLEPQTLAKWAMTGAKLPVVKIGRIVRYRSEDVEDLIRRSTVGTSQNEGAAAERNDHQTKEDNQ